MSAQRGPVSVAEATYLGVLSSATPMGWARISPAAPQEPANSSQVRRPDRNAPARW